MLEDKSFKGKILALKLIELMLDFAQTGKSLLLDQNLTSSFVGTFSIKMVLEV